MPRRFRRRSSGRAWTRPEAAALGFAGNSEWRGLQAVGPGARRQAGGALLGEEPRREGGVPAGSAACLWPADVPETTPVIGIVSRFATQKGFDFVAQIADQMIERNLAAGGAGQRRAVLREFLPQLGRAQAAPGRGAGQV
jgi:hypothetical protein